MIMDNENFNVEFGEVVNIGGGTSDFNQLSNRPKYNNTPMTGATNIPKVPTKTSELNNDSDYQTGTEVESAISTAIAGKQDTLTAGNNITISNNTISATDTTYSAGTGLTLDGTQFSVNTETIATQQDVSNEATARENADTNLQGQIDAISASSDVTDIVGTYADLQAYDTTHLKDNDIIKVLQDESQNGETTYYRWSTSTQTFTLIGEEGPYYTKSQTDTLLQAKQDTLTAGSNITIASDNTISATDTTYSAFTGTDGQTAGTSGLVPAPTTSDTGKFLKADGTWDTAGGGSGPTVVQTAGTSTTDVMSQNAATSMVFADPATATKVSIGNANAGTSAVSIGRSAYGAGEYSVALGYQANTYNGAGAVAIGQSARARASKAIAIGYNANGWQDTGASSVAVGSSTRTGDEAVSIGENAGSGEANTVAIGRNAKAQGRGSVAIGDGSIMPSGYVRGTVSFYTDTTGYGYNGSSNYRLLTGLYDGQSAHDAATVAQGNTLATSAPTTSTVGVLGQLYTDTTNMHTYQCTAISGGTYTWTQRW